MKTKDLIAALMQSDPSGEIECCVGNRDIHFVSRGPAYYDGALQVYIRDESNNIRGVKRTNRGKKIQIHSYSVADLLCNDSELPITYEDIGGDMESHYRKRDEKAREESMEVQP